MNQLNSDKKAMIYMMTASFSFALMAVMVKLSGGGIPLFEQVFFRNLIMIFFSGGMLYGSRTSIKVEKSQVTTLMARSFFGFLGVICVFYASNNLILADAQILQKLNPFFVTIFAVLLLGEKMTTQRAMTIVLGFTGAVIIINPTGNFTNVFPAMVGVASAVFGGMAYVMVRKMAGAVPGMVIIFYFSLFSTICSIFPMAYNFVVPNLHQLIYLILIGVFAASGQYFITKAYTFAEASKVTLFDYTGVAVSPILGLIVFQEEISIRTLVGMAIVIASGYWSSRLKK